MRPRTLKTHIHVDADDEFHLADTVEMQQLKDLDTDVLPTLGSDEETSSSDNPGFDPYNNGKTE